MEMRRGRAQPLPPIKYSRKRQLKPLDPLQRPTTPASGAFDLDIALAVFDASYLPGWLEAAKGQLATFRKWYTGGDNAVLFGHFWMSEIEEDRRGELLQMEYCNLIELLTLAFEDALSRNQITTESVEQVATAVLHEFPRTFYEDGGTGCLDLMAVLASSETDPYRRLLANIRCKTTNQQNKQWLLALRTVFLVGLISAIQEFFADLTNIQAEQGLQRPGTSQGSRHLAKLGSGRTRRPISPSLSTNPSTTSAAQPDSHASAIGSPLPSIATPTFSKLTPLAPIQRTGISSASAQTLDSDRPSTSKSKGKGGSGGLEEAHKAVRLGHADVLFYLASRSLVSFDEVDSKGRSLLFIAVVHNQLEVVQLLLENLEYVDLDRLADSGNSALHTAATNGNMQLVQLLLSHGASPNIENNVTGATPADMAEMFGHERIAHLLRSPEQHSAPQERPLTASARARAQGLETVATTLEGLELA
eukprot:m.296718 g.296718  ORF g.296718 m.296718 type:complete len:475 (-) comp15858_c1_seq6:3288-4712(-)